MSASGTMVAIYLMRLSIMHKTIPRHFGCISTRSFWHPPHDNLLPNEQPPTLLRWSRVHYIHTHWLGANCFAYHPSMISLLSTILFSEPVTSIGDQLVMLVCRLPHYLRGPKSAPNFFHCVLLVGKYYHELILTEMILGKGPNGSGSN